MPSSAVHTFTDPDDYAASIRGAGAELTVTGNGSFTAKLIRIDLHHLSMQRMSDNLPRISHSADFAGQATISFRTRPGPSLFRDGLEMHPFEIIRCSNNKSFFRRSAGLASMGSISLPVEAMADIEAIVGCDLTPPKDARSVRPQPAAMANLQRLHAAAGQLAEVSPAVIRHPEAARGLEQALVLAMVSCLGGSEVAGNRSALGRHAKIMGRFREAVEEKLDQAIFIPELCTAIGVSYSTLFTCCREHLGVSPNRYLFLRRMHLARRRLRESAPATTTVTEIATRYGFWQFGRFAGRYKSLFGEPPSITLRRRWAG